MASHKQHHYVPAFLLRQWHFLPKGKLTQFRWANGQLRHGTYTAQHVAKIEHLYSARRNAAQPDIALERDYLGPHVDDPASTVHAIMLSHSIEGLTVEQAAAWSRFLVAQMVRLPDMVEHMRIRGKEVLMAGLDANPEEYNQIRGNAPEETLSEWLQAHGPDMYDDLGVNAMPSIIQSKLLNGVMLEASWAVLDLKRSSVDLLIGDEPLVQDGPFSGKFSLALPISPRKLFLVFNDDEFFQRIVRHRETYIARAMNRITVEKAMRFVYGTSRAHEPLILKYLRKPDPALAI